MKCLRIYATPDGESHLGADGRLAKVMKALLEPASSLARRAAGQP
jgi:hypothetical protein